MSDYGTMVARIADELSRTQLNTQIGRAIITAIHFYQGKRFRFNQERATTTLIAGQEYYGLPSDFTDLDTAVLTDGGWKCMLEQASHYAIDMRSKDTDYRSQPSIISVQQDQFRLYPIPDKDTYTVEITYTKSFTDPTEDADTSPWFVEAEELIRLRAKVDILTNIIRGQESFVEAQYLAAREAEVLRELKLEYARSVSSGRVESSSRLINRYR